MEFCALSDVEWEFICSFLPSRPVRGRRRVVDDGSLINGILYVVTTGCRWRDMPSRYGSYVTAWRMLKRLHEVGVWDMILRFLASFRGSRGVAVDSTTVEAKRGVR